MVLFGALWLVLLSPALIQRAAKAPEKPRTGAFGKRVMDAMEAYRAEFGTYPDGSHAEMVRALAGENPRYRTFLQIPRDSINSQGELVDEWGTPFQLAADVEQDRFRVRSAGRNRQFERGEEKTDDYDSWQSSADGPGGAFDSGGFLF